jgi:hypothetical protein
VRRKNEDTEVDEDEVQAAKAETARLARLEELNDLRTVMSTRQGRRFVWRLLEMTGIYRSSYTGNADTYFREGARNVGLVLMHDIQEHCFDHFVEVMRERRDGHNDD